MPEYKVYIVERVYKFANVKASSAKDAKNMARAYASGYKWTKFGVGDTPEVIQVEELKEKENG